jgi:hypothetical protein
VQSSILCLQNPTTDSLSIQCFSSHSPTPISWRCTFHSLSITHYLPMTHSPLDTPTCTACASFSCVPRPQSSCSFLHPDIWQKVQIIKFFIMQFSPAFCYFFLHRNPAHTQNASVFAMTKIYVSSLLYREMICNWNGLLWLTFELPWTYPKSTLRLKPVLPVIYTASRKSNMQQNSSHWNDGVEMSHLILVSAFY